MSWKCSGCVRPVYSWACLCVCSWPIGTVLAKSTWNQSILQQGAWPRVPGATPLWCLLLYRHVLSILSSHSLHSLIVFFNRTDWTPSQSWFLYVPSFLYQFPLLHLVLCLSTTLQGEERSLHKAKAGTSLPVYIKDLSFKATGSAVRQWDFERENERDIKNINRKRLRETKMMVVIYSISSVLYQILPYQHSINIELK